MKYFPRLLDINSVLKKKSCFLFGPRQTGKSSLIENTLKDCLMYNLLDTQTYLSLSQNPQRLKEEIGAKDKIVVIDEIQRIPDLLNEVHLIIEQNKVNFLLTGSSARKLRHKGVNLLGGRARSRCFHPFVYKELGQEFDLVRAINHGLIPSIYFSDSPCEDLESYVGTYLREEVAAEGLTRNVPAFGRFLEVAALCNGKMINYTNIANDAQVARTTIHEYFGILKDTLIAYELPAWMKTAKRKPITTAKFYFFDIGVVNCLQHRKKILPRSPEFGDAFETYLFHELRAYVDYNKIEGLHYWRSKSQAEVDFILADTTAIEVKAKINLDAQDLKGLRAIREEKKLKNYIAVCLEQRSRTTDGIQILPVKIFLDRLWGGEFG